MLPNEINQALESIYDLHSIPMKSQTRDPSLPLKQISVLLAEDNTNFRKSLKLLVEWDGDIDVVGEAKNGCDAVRLTKKLHPEVVVMDIGMPMLNGLQATRQIMETSPSTRVLILSANPDPAYVMQAVTSGASGYLIKQSSTQFVPQAIREVLKGNSFFSASITETLREQCQKLFGKSELVKRKSARLALLAAA
jgi:DNA-binding NarL/FixJ family response regulator